MCRSVASYTLDNTLSKRLLSQQYVRNYEDRYLSRGTIARLPGLSIGIVSNNRGRAAPTISYCATGMLAKVHIDRYLAPTLFEKDSRQATVRAIPFYRHQSIPSG